VTSRACGAAVAVAGVLAGCGGRAADLIAVQRTGDIPGARLELVLTDDGRVRCNGGPDRMITSRQLIDARAIVRDLEGKKEEVGPADRGVALPPGRGSILRYRARIEAGSVSFADTSPRQPPAFFRLARLTRAVAKGPCGLAR
jgi:hypothetical protein